MKDVILDSDPSTFVEARLEELLPYWSLVREAGALEVGSAGVPRATAVAADEGGLAAPAAAADRPPICRADQRFVVAAPASAAAQEQSDSERRAEHRQNVFWGKREASHVALVLSGFWAFFAEQCRRRSHNRE